MILARKHSRHQFQTEIFNPLKDNRKMEMSSIEFIPNYYNNNNNNNNQYKITCKLKKSNKCYLIEIIKIFD